MAEKSLKGMGFCTIVSLSLQHSQTQILHKYTLHKLLHTQFRSHGSHTPHKADHTDATYTRQIPTPCTHNTHKNRRASSRIWAFSASQSHYFHRPVLRGKGPVIHCIPFSHEIFICQSHSAAHFYLGTDTQLLCHKHFHHCACLGWKLV